MSALRHRHKMVVDTRLGTPSFRGERPRKFSVWGVVNHTEISNYPYCLSSPSNARCACRATHTSPLLNLPRLNSSRRLAATGLPSRPQRHGPVPCGPATPPTKLVLAKGEFSVWAGAYSQSPRLHPIALDGLATREPESMADLSAKPMSSGVISAPCDGLLIHSVSRDVILGSRRRSTRWWFASRLPRP